MVEDADIEAVMNRAADPQRCASQLVNEAIAAGGHDNITVVVADVTGKREAQRKKVALKTKVTVAAVLVLFAALVAGALWAANAYVHHSAYLAEEDGCVAVYKGLPEQFLFFSYSELDEQTDIPVDELSPGVADRIREGLRVDDVEAARALVEEYRSQLEGDAGAGTDADADAAADESADEAASARDADDEAADGADAGARTGNGAASHSGSNALTPQDVARGGEGA